MTVEFALIVPILLLLVFGLIQYGFFFMAYQSGSDAVRTAVRESSVGDPPSCSELRDRLTEQVSAVGDGVVVTRVYQKGANGQLDIGDQVRVSLVFNSIDLGLPLVPFVAGGRVETDAMARVEYVDTVPRTDCP